MSTVKSSSENLTLNADGAGNDVVIQSNGTTKATFTAQGLNTIAGSDYEAAITATSNSSAANWARIDIANQNASEKAILYQDIAGTFTLRNLNDGSPITFQTTNGGASAEAMRIDSSGNLKYNSGYGSVATAYGCRAWVKFNGSGTVAINNSANVSSITDLGTGRYRVNFTTAMVDADFAAVSSNANRDGGCYGHSTTDVGVFAGESAVDSTIISVAIFR